MNIDMPKYCTFCGAELIAEEGLSKEFDAYTGKRRVVILLSCPKVTENSYSEFARHTDRLEIKTGSSDPACWGCTENALVVGCPLHDPRWS